MTDEQFETAKRLRDLISRCESDIEESEKLLKSDYTYITFSNSNVIYKSVTFSEDEAFIKTAIKIAIIDFKERLYKYKEELKNL